MDGFNKKLISAMNSLKYTTLLAFCTIFFYNCSHKSDELPSMSLINLGFDGKIENRGTLPVSFKGDRDVSYSEGVYDKAFDISAHAANRQPLIIEKSPENSFEDYPGFSLFFWVKGDSYDHYNYSLVSQLTPDDGSGVSGWRIEKTECGGWSWWMSDGDKVLNYNPMALYQTVNDGEWHLLGFSVNKSDDEVRLYYNGRNVAIYCLRDMGDLFKNREIAIGADPFAGSMIYELFNGYIDELSVWGRSLSCEQVKTIYREHKSDVKFRRRSGSADSVTVMTWNIWNGGDRDGKFAGVHRVASIIEESGADIVALQDVEKSGPQIADELGFYYYHRSEKLGIVSRFPFKKTHNIYRPQNSAAVTIEVSDDDNLIFCPLLLSKKPDLESYILQGEAVADSIVEMEMETRGAEIRYIMWEIQSLMSGNSGVPVIIAGNFNSGSHLDWTSDNKHNRYGLVVDFPATLTVQQAGFVDVYRQFYPDVLKNPGYTWSPRYRDVLHNRVDFIFHSNAPRLRASSVKIVDESPWRFPSNHAAVKASFGFEEID
ncbi:endonuclease/exonuclease/phosphatase family protein [Marinilabiliaceae bacterium ANBcel2]|nr:endonuclease/exonuclease/phosphatase family protein [Marinilabiliaceae bacterium ANBcel2]